ncbi:MAG: DUF1232 domain-containing protein [Chloroflexi bacterium]|nr:DUF1232 domain-containing protein [Chloroflexota bacterium]
MYCLPALFRFLSFKRLRLFWRLFRDRRVPWYAKALLPLMVFYLAKPLDPIPDVIPFLGQLDDVVVLAVGGWLFLRLCPPEVVREHRRALEG